MSAGGYSTSESESRTTNVQETATTQGGGDNSTTLAAKGSIVYNDAGGEVSIEALKGMRDVVKDALKTSFDTLSEYSGRQIDASTRASQDNTALLGNVLASNSSLAANVQSGGAERIQNTLNYAILGALGIGALWALSKFFKS